MAGRIPQVALAGNGSSLWVNHDTYQTPPAITLAGFVTPAAVLTWAVQYTCDDIGPGALRPVQLSQTTTVITVTDSGPNLLSASGIALAPFGHGLSVGDWYKLQGTGIANVDGEYAVTTVPTPNTLTLTSLVSQTVSSSIGQAVSARVFPHATLTGQTARATGNYAFPVKASRLVVSGYTSGTAFLEVLQGGMSS